jgi:hypothetical protein
MGCNARKTNKQTKCPTKLREKSSRAYLDGEISLENVARLKR